MYSSLRYGWELPVFGLEDLSLDNPYLMMHLAGFCMCTRQCDRTVLSHIERRAFSELKLPSAPTGEPPMPPERGKVSSESKTAFPLMNLPMELRIMIYMFHFNRLDDRQRHGLEFCFAGDFCPFRRYNNDVPVRMLLMVSRAVYEEAMPLYFRKKTFRFLHNGLAPILRTIGPRHRRHISKIVFLYNVVKTAEDFPLLKDCPALTELIILVDEVPLKYKDGRRVGMIGLPGLKLLLQIRGIKKLSVKFSVSVKQGVYKEEMEGFIETLQVLKEPYGKNRRPRGAAWKLVQGPKAA